MRVFYAVKFADYVKQAFVDNITEIKKYTLRGNFMAKDNFHITLVFVGECDTGKLALLKKAADKTVENLNLPERFKTNPIIGTIDGLGTFSRPFGEELLWVGVKTNPEDILAKINKSIIKELANCGIYTKEDHAEYIPHITIARKVEFSRISSGELDQINFTPIDFTVNSITLMESTQEVVTTYGRRYTKLVYKPLYESRF